MFRSQINPLRSFQRFSAADLAASHSSLASAPLTPFPATLSWKSQLIENPAALSQVVATLARHLHHNLFVCHSYKKHPGWRGAIVNFFVARTSVCAPLGHPTSEGSETKHPQELRNLAVLPVTRHQSPGTSWVRSLPPVTSHQSRIANSFIIRTSIKLAHKLFRMNTSKTQHLEPFRMNTYKKTGGGAPSWLSRNSWNDLCPERRTRAQDLSCLPAEILPASLNRDKKGAGNAPKKTEYYPVSSISAEARPCPVKTHHKDPRLSGQRSSPTFISGFRSSSWPPDSPCSIGSAEPPRGLLRPKNEFALHRVRAAPQIATRRSSLWIRRRRLARSRRSSN